MTKSASILPLSIVVLSVSSLLAAGQQPGSVPTPPSVPGSESGVDARRGASFSIHVEPRVDDTGAKMPVTPHQVDQAITIIKKRLTNMGMADPIIARQGADGILLQTPGVTPEESDNIKKTLEKVVKLEVREVSARNDEPGGYDNKSLAARVAARDEIVPGYKAFTYKFKDEDGNEHRTPILLNRRAALGGKDIAIAVPSPLQAHAVLVTLNGDGTNKMIALTKDMTPLRGRIAIVLDGVVVSAPVLIKVPLGKYFVVEGLREPGEVQSLANALTNPLENALRIDEIRNVSPARASVPPNSSQTPPLVAPQSDPKNK